MATETVPTPEARAADLAKVTNDICYQAAQEISAIARMLRGQSTDTSEFDYLLHGSLIRLEALGASIVGTVGTTDRAEIAEGYETVYGEKLLVLLGEPLEVAHG